MMLYALMNYLYAKYHFLTFLRLFDYLSFRAIWSAVTAFIVSILLGPTLIRFLKRKHATDVPWIYGTTRVNEKEGTPTMGGIIILGSVLIATLLWCNLSNRFIHILLFALIWFGVLGFIDDFSKLTQKSKAGVKEHYKLLAQAMFGLLLGIILFHPKVSPIDPSSAGKLFLPFLKNPVANFGIGYIFFIIFTITAISNSVNLTDGLDGLAITPVIFIAGVFGIFAYVIGNYKLAQYLLFNYLRGSGEIAVFALAVIGAGIGFLWYNTYPAQIFMGDTGSLALGGLLGVMAVLIKQEFLFVIAGGIFVIEAASVFLHKYIYIPRMGRRLFFRTPFHLSFQHRGLAETKVVVRFWIVSAILALIALSSLKIR